MNFLEIYHFSGYRATFHNKLKNVKFDVREKELNLQSNEAHLNAVPKSSFIPLLRLNRMHI